MKAPLKLMHDLCERLKIPFVMVGGLAINAYGVSRQTGDADFMIEDAALETVSNGLIGEGFEAFRQTEVCARFRHTAGAYLDIDLLLVNRETLEKVLATSQPYAVHGLELRVPSAKVLVAMKLHAIKHGGFYRELKDMPDVVGIVKHEGIKVADPDFKAWVLQYGDERLYADLVRYAESWA